jgi:hypothetical protein
LVSQVPAEQTSPLAQAVSQAPQLAGSTPVSTHLPVQSVVPPTHLVPHCPAEHTSPALQVVPH